MATGRSNKLVGQTGEYLVAAELLRRGLIATTFTGNVPHYDIIASDETGRLRSWRRMTFISSRRSNNRVSRTLDRLPCFQSSLIASRWLRRR